MSTATLEAPEDLSELTPEQIDPDAPYGRNAKGEPYKRPAEWRAKTTAHLKQMRDTASAVAGATARAGGEKRGPGRPRKTADPVDYTPGILGLVQLPAFMLGMLAPLNPALQLDAAALLLHGPTVASAINSAAQQNETLAAMLDKILAIGPWGALLGALLPLALQLAANHGLVPAGPQTSTLAADQLMAHMEQLRGAAPAAAAA